MIPSNPIPSVCNYGSSAAYCTCPSDEQVANGVVPLDSLPAAWWNWLWSKSNTAINCARTAAGALITEINNVLCAAGVCPQDVCTDQLYQSIEKIRQTLGNATTAGAVKSSSDPSAVAIDAYGYMSVNCLGNAASLTTTARTVVGAINELKSTYDCCICDINTAICDLQSGKAPTMHASCETTYGVGNASCYGHLKISDTYASCVGGAAEGVAASQKALYDAYTCLASMPVTFAECACCIQVNNCLGSQSIYYPIMTDGGSGFREAKYSQSVYYNKCTDMLHVTGGMYNSAFIQKKGMLNLNTLPSCLVIDNTWKVCAYKSGNNLAFRNYGTEYVIVNYGNLQAGEAAWCSCSNLVAPVFPLNVILAPSETVVIPMRATCFANRPAAVITF